MDLLLIPGLFRARPVLRSIAAARSAGRVRVTPVIESPVRTIGRLSASVAIRLPRSRISLPAREPPLLPFLVAIAKYSRKVAYIAIHYFEFATVSFVFKRLAPQGLRRRREESTPAARPSSDRRPRADPSPIPVY